MKDFYLSSLRDSKISLEAFRAASKQLATLLLAKASEEIPLRNAEVKTPLGTAEGKMPACKLILAPILRSGLALLPPALTLFPDASIGMLGIRRDERTAAPHLYYQNLPSISPQDWVFVLDPMLATGCSAILAIKKLLDAGAKEERITLISLIASKPGTEKLKESAPKVKQILGTIDPTLNKQKFIVPGLGDFGDRYFGTQ